MSDKVNPLVQTKTLKEMQDATERVAAEAEDMEAPVIDSLVGYLKTRWEEAYDAKRDIETVLLENMRQKLGEYDESKKSEIARQGGSDVYIRTTNKIVNAAKAWIQDIVLTPGTRPWKASPSPIPDLPPEQMKMIVQQVLQEAMTSIESNITPEMVYDRAQQLRDDLDKDRNAEASEKADKMSNLIHDQFIQNGWYRAVSLAVDDVVTYKAGFIKGPILINKKQLKYVGKSFKPEVVEVAVPQWSRVSPFDLYPEPDIETVDDGYMFERMRFSQGDLSRYKGLPYFNDDNIDQILNTFSGGTFSDWLSIDSERRDLENKGDDFMRTAKVDCLAYWGDVPGDLLAEWGMKVEDENMTYDCSVWWINNVVIYCKFNPDRLGRKPYYKASYINVEGAFWGEGIPETMRDSQLIINGCARALVDNLSMSAGPQVVINIDRLADGEEITALEPRRIWQTVEPKQAGNNSPAIDFYQPNSNAGTLLSVLDRFLRNAEDDTGVPSYIAGESRSTGGAARTLGGLSILQGNASKGIKQVIKNIDEGFVAPSVERQYNWNMENVDDPSIKGDLNIQARGAISLLIKEEMQARRQQFLALTNNQVDASIVDPIRRSNVLRAIANDLDLPEDSAVPTEEEMIQRVNSQPTPEEEMIVQQQIQQGEQ